MSRTRAQGDGAEKDALAHLREQGLELIETNFRSRHGEIDLVMRERDTVVFVEVRYRKHASFGGALSSIDANKQRKLTLTGLTWLQARRTDAPCRFDVVAFGADGQLEWVRNAFDAQLT